MQIRSTHGSDVDSGAGKAIAAAHTTLGTHRTRAWLDHHLELGEHVVAVAVGHQGSAAVVLAVTEERAVVLTDPVSGQEAFTHPLRDITSVESIRHGNARSLRVTSVQGCSLLLRIPPADADAVVDAMTSRRPAAV